MNHLTEIKIHTKTETKGYIREITMYIDNAYITDTIIGILSNTKDVITTCNRVITERCHDDR